MRRPQRPVTGPRPKRERDPQRRRNRRRGSPKNKSASKSTASATISTVVMRVCYPTRGDGKRSGVSKGRLLVPSPEPELATATRKLEMSEVIEPGVPSDVDAVVKAVDGQYQEWFATLGELVRIPSVSGDPAHAVDVERS